MTGSVFLITGAAGGIGAATARRAVAAGYRVVLAGRDEARLKLLAEELGGAERALPVRCDVQDWAAQQALVGRALDVWGRLDVVFANAGVASGAGFVRGEATPEEWRAMVLTNIFGVAATARLSLPALIENRGHLLLMGSVVGRVAIPGSFYSATKWAVTGMSESIRAELIGTGVRVSVIQAGFVDTPLLARRPEGPILAAEDVARTVLWALEQPPHVDINEVLIRPVGQLR
jgi:NADP-dependent 3-hydroxy acid dehydrogenase YdfG